MSKTESRLDRVLTLDRSFAAPRILSRLRRTVVNDNRAAFNSRSRRAWNELFAEVEAEIACGMAPDDILRREA